MKKVNEHGIDGRSGGKKNTGENKSHALLGEHCPTNPVTLTAHKVQAALPSPTPTSIGGKLK